ncbi:MAG: xanthine dehydrogenase family protein molybdopterin-binding subunit, partial [Acidimicrobiia bacterium]
LMASSFGAGRRMKFSAAVSDEGKLTALDVDLIDDVGAYLRPPEPSTLYRCFGNLTGAYRIGGLRARARAVVTNKAPTGLNRGFGGQQLYFGLERLMDRIARELGTDPAELRRNNFVPAGAFPYRTPSGGIYDSGDYAAALELLLHRAHYPGLRREQTIARAQGRMMGIGLATIVDPSGTNLGYVSVATPAEVRGRGHHKSGSTEMVAVSIDPSGQVTVRLGSTPQGQGHETVARQVVADQLGVLPSQVRVSAAMDTATTPWTVTSGSYSSRFAPLTTSALVEAAEQLAVTLKAAASVRLEVPVERLELASGMIRVVGEPGRAFPIRHAAGMVHWDPGSLPEGVEPRLSVEAAFSPQGSVHPASDDTVNSSICYGFVADLVVVEVDPATLEIRVRQIVSVHDAGTVLNPALLDGQTLGSIAHALGGALFEEFAWSEEGQPLVTTFMDYLCPTAAEMAFELELDHVVTPSPFTRLGAKGSGEGSSMSIPAALANALEDALGPLGLSCDSLPLTSSALHRALVGKEPNRWR